MLKNKNFKLKEVLDWQTWIKEIDPLKIQDLSIEWEKFPFYWQSTQNNWIIDYYSLINDVLNNKEAKPTILIHSNNQNLVYLETPFYLKDWHWATSVLQKNILNRYIALYFLTTIWKNIKNKFDYNAKATKIALKNTEIVLPTQNWEIDFEFMETFIRAVEKLVIKDLVIWNEKKIQAYREVINKKN